MVSPHSLFNGLVVAMAPPDMFCCVPNKAKRVFPLEEKVFRDIKCEAASLLGDQSTFYLTIQRIH